MAVTVLSNGGGGSEMWTAFVKNPATLARPMGNLSTMDTAVGIVLVVVGALGLLGQIGLGWIVTVAAVAAVVVGILMLLGKMQGRTTFAIVLLVLGLLLLFPDVLGIGKTLGGIIEIVAAVLLLVLGVLKLMGKW